MVVKLKLRKQGGSLAATLPAELVKKMGVREGDTVYLVEVAPGEFRVSPYDPAVAKALEAHEAAVAEYRDVFRALAE